jgi:amidase
VTSIKHSHQPAIEDIIAVARELRLNVTPDTAAIYQRHLLARVEATADFLDSELDGAAAPAVTGRDPGHAPSCEEDPLAAWLWKCQVRGAPAGPLAGKTVGFKDHIAVAGVPLTFGSPALRDFVPDFDATVVSRVLAAGGTIVGKNSLDGFEGGAGVSGRPSGSRRPKNPHRPSHVTGGSSSGSAVAVAAGEVDISFGGCQGGSVRIPAAWCGCLGLKPTFGLVSHFGAGFGHDWTLDYLGPLARSHRELAAAFDAVAGYDELDPRAGRDIPARMDALGVLEDGVAGLRLGLVDEGFEGAEPEVGDAVLAAVDVLAAAGAHVTRVSLPEHLLVGDAMDALYCEGARALRATGFLGAFATTYYPEALVAAMNRYWRDHSEHLSEAIKFRYLVGEFSKRAFDGRAYARAQNVRPHFVRAYDRALTNVDVLVMPTVIRTAPKYDASDEQDLDAILSGQGPREYWFNRNTKPMNYTGHPALAIPCGKSSAGLPISMQLVGSRLADPLLIRVGYAYEHSVDWGRIVGLNGELHFDNDRS